MQIQTQSDIKRKERKEETKNRARPIAVTTHNLEREEKGKKEREEHVGIYKSQASKEREREIKRVSC